MPAEEQPEGPIAVDDLPWEAWRAATRAGLRRRHLSRAALGEAYRIAVILEELPPGGQSASAHYHLSEEEHVFLLEGRLTARIGSERYPMQPGDYVCFPAGRRAGHCLLNEDDAPALYVLVGEKDPKDVVVYPDSATLRIPYLDRLLDLGAVRDEQARDTPELSGGEPLPAPPPLAEDDPLPPVSSKDVPWDQEGEGPVFGGRSKHLTYAAIGAPDYRIGVVIESPAPGMRLCPTHYHMLEEEHALVLEGQLTLILGDARHEMGPGDYACFPAGRKLGHSFLNSGDGPCRYLMIGANDPNDVCVYPDSNRMEVRALGGAGAIFEMTPAKA